VRVTDDEDAPLPGVTVTLLPPDGTVPRVAITRADGDALLPGLAAGTYQLRFELEGFSTLDQTDVRVIAGEATRAEAQLPAAVEDTITVTAGGGGPLPLRMAYERSPLVVLGVVGPSRIVGRRDDTIELVTQVQVERTLKGEDTTEVAFHHTDWDAQGMPDAWRNDLTPGKAVLLFLAPDDDASRIAGAPIFMAVDGGRSPQALDDDARDAYRERLETLAGLEARGAQRGGIDPDALAEWLVASAEQPSTRADVTGELGAALNALEDVAKDHHGDALAGVAALLERRDREHERAAGMAAPDPEPAFVGAAVTERQGKRLVAALRRSETLDEGNRRLYFLARHFDASAADAWLVEQLRASEPRPGDAMLIGWLADVAQQVSDPAVQKVSAAAHEREDALLADVDDSVAAWSDPTLLTRIAEIERDAQHAFAAALARVR
jgi:hypothetical protein